MPIRTFACWQSSERLSPLYRSQPEGCETPSAVSNGAGVLMVGWPGSDTQAQLILWYLGHG